MATEGIISDVGVIYKRLLNHRPVIQNEVHHFVKEFEGQRGDNDLHSLQSSMSMASEMDVVFLEEIMTTSPHFRRIRKQAEEISELCSEIISKERNDLNISQEEQARHDEQVENYRKQLQREQEAFEIDHAREVQRLREEIQAVREARSKLRPGSCSSSHHSLTATSSVDVDQNSTTSSGGEPSGGDPSGGGPSGGDPSGGGEPSGGEPSGGEPSGGEPSGGDLSGGDPSGGGEPSGGEPSGGEPSGGEPSGGEASRRGRELGEQRDS